MHPQQHVLSRKHQSNPFAVYLTARIRLADAFTLACKRQDCPTLSLIVTKLIDCLDRSLHSIVGYNQKSCAIHQEPLLRLALVSSLALAHRLMKLVRHWVHTTCTDIAPQLMCLDLYGAPFLTLVMHAAASVNHCESLHAYIVLIDIFKTASIVVGIRQSLGPILMKCIASQAALSLHETDDRSLHRKALELIKLIVITTDIQITPDLLTFICSTIKSYLVRVFLPATVFLDWWASLKSESFTEFCFVKDQLRDRQCLKFSVQIYLRAIANSSVEKTMQLINGPLSSVDDLLGLVYGFDFENVPIHLFELFADHDGELIALLEELLRIHIAHLPETTSESTPISRVAASLWACDPSRMLVMLLEIWNFDHTGLLDLVILDDTYFQRYLVAYITFARENPQSLRQACQDMVERSLRPKSANLFEERDNGDESDDDATDFLESTLSTLSDLLQSIESAYAQQLITKDVSDVICALNLFFEIEPKINVFI
ncbi:hypothetical protein BASA82_000753 [Batrachochytrium salamandrivorans]|uniref:Protein Lines N-terminal domain-containing protein n=1 Tax=Batrachochytrium salamandrivorans TaxID=1357716 RepID=A0ABQ8FA06_9FUNG|nr:hypothetical protein BASA60_009021 [Batrachochytrium salamandrivorans]KAH6594688.1 hypothetical protein BASA50_006366 [Batrachochytrium salamandrivorans]KAH9262209.1 hypothetical protein BASA82_000753 [Batrachochytrium salamandrivorans]